MANQDYLAKYKFKFVHNNSMTLYVNSFLASVDVCRLLITYANGLDPDLEDPNCLRL